MGLRVRSIGLLAALLLAAGASSAAQAAVVTATSLNCRSEAVRTAPVVVRLSRGDEVDVLEVEGSWSRVDPAATGACWVSSRFLVSDASRLSASSTDAPSAASSRTPSRAYGPSARADRRGSSPRRSARRSRSKSAPIRAFGGSSCPCSGGNVCVGPRGGRYCITSGGNKRYGV